MHDRDSQHCLALIDVRGGIERSPPSAVVLQSCHESQKSEQRRGTWNPTIAQEKCNAAEQKMWPALKAQPLSWEIKALWSPRFQAAASQFVGYQPKVLICTFGAAASMEGIRKLLTAHQPSKAMVPLGAWPGRMVVVDGTV